MKRGSPFGGRAWLVYVGSIVAVSGVYAAAHYVGPHWLNSGPVFNLIGLSVILAILVGARSTSSGQRLPWYLLALGQTLFVIGDVLAYNYTRLFGTPLPFPSIADVFYLAFYVPLVAALLLLIPRSRNRDHGGLIDSLILTIAAGALSWTYLMAPYAHDATLDLKTKLVSIAYPLMDLLVLGVLARLVDAGGRRTAGFVLLVLGFATLLVTDSVYGWMLLRGTYHPGAPLDLGWAAFYVMLGAAALHPSTRALIQHRPPRAASLTVRRIGLLAAASLTIPVGVFVRNLEGEQQEVKTMAAASAVLFVLVLLRMTGLARRHDVVVRSDAKFAADLAAAQQGAKEKDTFVAQVSHELRTPLTSICGYVDLLRERGPGQASPAEQVAFLDIVDRNAARLLSLVEDLLFAAQLDDGGFALDKSEFNFAEVTAESVEAARPAADKRSVTMRVRSTKSLTVRGDRPRLRQVVDHLLSNAVKFTREGGDVTVDATRSNGNIRIVIGDTGLGLRADELEHLFERFYRTDSAIKEAVRGTGLGLSLTKSIIEAHGGTIAASSKVGVGTSLTVEIPAD